MRLYFFYSAQDRPLLQPSDLPAAAAPTAADESADGATADESAADESAGDKSAAGSGSDEKNVQAAASGCKAEPVPAELQEQLARYRDMACLSYDFDTGWLPLPWLPLRLPLWLLPMGCRCGWRCQQR
jgi:hypothetical protein